MLNDAMASAEVQDAEEPPQRARLFRKTRFPLVSDGEWNDWRWQLANRVVDPAVLGRMLELSERERACLDGKEPAPAFSVTPHYLSLIDPDNPADPLRRTVIPDARERVHAPFESSDSLAEERDSPLPGIVHRYPDRVLFIATEFCSTLCRYCTRSRLVFMREDGGHPERGRWESCLEYIRGNSAIRDVLVSGGDPLTLADDALDWLLGSLRAIPHVEIIRVGTKAPVVLPQRITPSLVAVLKRHHPLYMNIHFSHPAELGAETRVACARLADAGIPLGSQTVLLAGVNDDPGVMKELMQALLRLRVRPYYIYQCDLVSGSGHFRTPVSTGIRIIQTLRGHTSGLAVPSFVIDLPDGGGKVPLLPEYLLDEKEGFCRLRNYRGQVFRYPSGTPGEGR